MGHQSDDKSNCVIHAQVEDDCPSSIGVDCVSCEPGEQHVADQGRAVFPGCEDTPPRIQGSAEKRVEEDRGEKNGHSQAQAYKGLSDHQCLALHLYHAFRQPRGLPEEKTKGG